MSVVYLTEEQVETLRTVAERIGQFQHKNDALLLLGMIEESPA